jgi:hypothetical protein
MNVEIGTGVMEILFWEHLFRIFALIVSLQYVLTNKESLEKHC